MSSLSVYCPKCNGPGKIDYRWTGEAFAVCDAYQSCGYDLAEALGTRESLRHLDTRPEVEPLPLFGSDLGGAA